MIEFQEYTPKLAKLCQEWRLRSNMKLDDIAEVVGCSKSHIWEFLQGKTNINYDLGKRIEYCIETKLCKRTVLEQAKESEER